MADEADLQRVVGSVGPASVCFQVSDDFRSYKSGVYVSERCSRRTADVNHAVVVVGYDHDDETGLDFWIVRNSWGPEWGDGGYFRILRGQNECGIADCASYPVVIKAVPSL